VLEVEDATGVVLEVEDATNVVLEVEDATNVVLEVPEVPEVLKVQCWTCRGCWCQRRLGPKVHCPGSAASRAA
jgi:hypothetical protein